MTRRERVISAINHQATELVPHQIDLTIPARERLIAHVGDPGYLDRMDNHMTGTGYGSMEETSPGSMHYRDQYGVVWNRTVDKDIGVVEGHVIPEPNLQGWQPPKIDEQMLRDRFQKAIENAGDQFSLMNIGFSLFERAWTLRGMENLLTDMIDEPEFVHELLDAICEHNLQIIELALDYPFDAIMFGDDWGQQRGTIMGARYWRTFMKPRVARMMGRAKEAGRFVLLHSCGDIHELFPDLIEIGLDVYQTFQPEIYDIHAIKRDFGRNLTFWGGISTQRLLPFATPDEVKKVSREMMHTMGAGGGYIVAPTHAVPGDVPPENIVAMVEVFTNQH
jgi:uroporphyrinogen decarboxylase